MTVPLSELPPPRSLKLVLIGDGGVGKTALRSRFLTGHFTPAYRATIGADFLTKTIAVDPEDPDSLRVTVSVWDTAGQERFAALGSSFYRGADAVIIAFDSTSSISHIKTRLAYWYNEFVTKTPIPANEHGLRFCWVCVGCKTDLLDPALSSSSSSPSSISATTALKQKEVQAVLDAILPRPGSDIQAEALTPTIAVAPESQTAIPLDMALVADRRKSLPLPIVMSKRASKQSLRSTISVKPLPTPPPPDSANSASRSRTPRTKRGADPAQMLQTGSSSALGLTRNEFSDNGLDEPVSEGPDTTPTRNPIPLPKGSGSDLGHSTTLPVGTPTSTDSDPESSALNPSLYGSGIYLNGKPHQRDRLDSSVSITSTIYHTPRNSTFFGSSPANRFAGLTVSTSDQSHPSTPTPESRARTSLDSKRSGTSSSRPNSSGLRRSTSKDSIASNRTVKGDGSSVGHGSNGTSSARTSLDAGPDARMRKGSSLANAVHASEGEEQNGHATEGGDNANDGPSQHSLARPRPLMRERSSDTVIGDRHEDEDQAHNPDQNNVEDAQASDRPQSGISTDTDTTHSSWNQPTPRPGSWATQEAEREADKTPGQADALNDAEDDDDDEEEDEDEYGLRQTRHPYQFSLEPIPFPSSSAGPALYLEPEHEDHLSRRMSRHGTTSGNRIDDPKTSTSNLSLALPTGGEAIPLGPTDMSASSSSASSSQQHHLQSKKDAVQAELERWREARSKKRRSRLGTNATRVDSIRSSMLAGGGDGDSGSPGGGSSAIVGVVSSSGSAVPFATKSDSASGGGESRSRKVSSVGHGGIAEDNADGSSVGDAKAQITQKSSRRSSMQLLQSTAEADEGVPNGTAAELSDLAPQLNADAEGQGSSKQAGDAQPEQHMRSSSPTHLDPSDPEPRPLEEGFHLFFTSSKTGTQVGDVFDHIISRVSARWAYEEWEEREYKRAVREWKAARRLEGSAADATRGKRWLSLFGKGRKGKERARASGQADEGEDEDDGDDEDERTKLAVQRAIRIAAGKDPGTGSNAWSVRTCCT
ncbi:hypothetical protein OC846_003842 [Tilletia horrida]|uniref:Uncharacterized protein n=1 Tax=Tilletia horrida TaxID=155126 RepID=A0AAN6GPS1_9BASI|nr:hypothetical protein OC846_003842 [Tilletia horrida]